VGDYNRTTRECGFEQLRPELVVAIRKYVQKHRLGHIEAETLMCCETTSEKKKRGLLATLFGPDRDPVHYTAALVTPSLLLWARSGAKSGTAALAARLAEIEVQDYETSPFGQTLADTGLEVFGFLLGAPERTNAFIGLGSEPAAQRFREVVKEAAGKARGCRSGGGE